VSQAFYLTTTLPYVNADPHIGFALEIVQADVIARYHQLMGDLVFFNTGTDEHGQKIYQKALEENKDPQIYCDEYAAKFDKLKSALNLSYNAFIRTTDQNHIKATQHFWTLCQQNDDIYKKIYKVKYCIGCELEKTDSELVNGHCPLHPNKELELREEENYFFKFSKYQSYLLDLYKNNLEFVIPSWRLTEIRSFVKNGLQDFSISRLKAKMPWGIPVPNDPNHVMYVWFDALINYISTLGWPQNKERFTKFWGTKGNPNALQVAGKDNLRQQSAMWQAMLASAGLPSTRQILIHGFITSGGQKMSKSLGNVVDPFAMVEKYGSDAVRYYLLKEINPFEDGDFTEKRFIEIYNSDLANGLGNLVQRGLTLASKFCNGKIPAINQEKQVNISKQDVVYWKKYDKKLRSYQFHEALMIVQEYITKVDKFINDQKPWEIANKPEKQKGLEEVIYELLEHIHQITWMIYPFLPTTAIEIAKRLNINSLLVEKPLIKDSWHPLPFHNKVVVNNPLFPRI